MTKYRDFTFNQGADVSIELKLTNKDKTPKDLTGYTISSKMSPSYTADSSEKVSFTSIVSDALNGVVNLSLTNVQTDALRASKRYVYDVEASFVDSDANTIIERILEGQIYVNPSVTR